MFTQPSRIGHSWGEAQAGLGLILAYNPNQPLPFGKGLREIPRSFFMLILCAVFRSLVQTWTRVAQDVAQIRRGFAQSYSADSTLSIWSSGK